MRSISQVRILGLLLASAAAWPSGAAAQSGSGSSPNPPAKEDGLEDIIVTARRVSEVLQSTPVAVTAMSADALKVTQINDASALQRVAPGLSIATGAPSSNGFVYLSIRGQGNLNPASANDPAVGTYVDDIYIPRPSQGLTDLFDMERIEVLRGPQGTLFGRNTPGGAINIVTAKPEDVFSAAATAELGNFDQRRFNVVANTPLGSTLAARVVYSYAERDGFAHDVAEDRPLNDRQSHFVRGKLRWEPSDDWNVTLSADYNRIKDSGQFTGLHLFDPTTFVGSLIAPFLHTKSTWYTGYNNPNTYLPRPELYDDLEAWGLGAIINGRLGAVDIKSVTGYRFSDARGNTDLDGTPIAILGNQIQFRSRQISQELQASGYLGERLSYVLGAYYSHEKGLEQAFFQFFGAFGNPPATNDGDAINTSVGLFSQANYRVTDKLRVTGGLRWTWDKREVVLRNLAVMNNPASCSVNTSDPAFFPPCNLPQSAKFNYPAWTAGIDYQASESVFLYAKTSGAAQSGGYNLRIGSVPAFKPTKTKDVEIGAKLDFLDKHVRLNAALFYNWISDVQRNAAATVPAGPGGSLITTSYVRNAGDARTKGAEFELTVIPWQGMLLSGNLSLLRGHYVAGSFTEPQTLPDGSIVTVDRSGEALQQLPRTQFGISATQTVETGIGSASFHLDYAYVSSQNFGLVTAAAGQSAAVKTLYATANAGNTIPGYGVLNGRAGLTLNNGMELYVFGKNILDKKYVTRRFADLYSQGAGFGTEYIGDPQTYGAGIIIRFGKR